MKKKVYRIDDNGRECTKCEVYKEWEHFSKGINSTRGYTCQCKKCLAIYNLNTREQRKIRAGIYYKENSEEINTKNAIYKKNHKDDIILQGKAYREKHKAEITFKKNKNSVKRYHTDPAFKILINLRSRVGLALKAQNADKNFKTIDLLGCSPAECRKYLEFLWTEGMSWGNHAVDGWHIDHIIPCKSFNLTDPEQQKLCFHYTNLQPLWAKDNLDKSYNLDWEK